MRAYHYLMIAFTAFFVGIPTTAINLGGIRNTLLYLGVTGIACIVLAIIAFGSFMAFIDIRDQEQRSCV